MFIGRQVEMHVHLHTGMQTASPSSAISSAVATSKKAKGLVFCISVIINVDITIFSTNSNIIIFIITFRYMIISSPSPFPAQPYFSKWPQSVLHGHRRHRWPQTGCGCIQMATHLVRRLQTILGDHRRRRCPAHFNRIVCQRCADVISGVSFKMLH